MLPQLVSKQTLGKKASMCKRRKFQDPTLEIAHMLKWTMYSSLVIPPFPTSSMSGSIFTHTQKKGCFKENHKSICLHEITSFRNIL